tara:strand:+ start:578 stop:1381 length:804 start_codon:yes stop_codon:yes gene_type:complete
MNREETYRIIKEGYSNIDKHPLKNEIEELRDCFEKLNGIVKEEDKEGDFFEVICRIILCCNVISVKVINMIPERGDMTKFSSFAEMLSVHPSEMYPRIRHSLDFENIKEKVSNLNVIFYDNNISLVSKQFEKVQDLKLVNKKKDLSDSDLEIDKAEQLNSIEFTIHLFELMRYNIAEKWGISDSFSGVNKFDYDAVQLMKVNFLNKLIDDTFKIQIREWNLTMERFKDDVLNRLIHLIKFLEVNSSLSQEILVNWSIEKRNVGRMYS